MAASPAGPLDSWRRLAAERRIVITAAAVVVILFFVGAACSGEDPAKPDAAGGTTTPSTASVTDTPVTTTAPTTTTPPAVRVAEVVDGRTVTVSGGGRVQLAGLAQPGECWAASAVDFLKTALAGKDLQVVGGTVLLPDGVDVAVHVLGQGMARADSGATAALVAAQDAAKSTGLGLWGAPCSGADTVAPAPPPVHTAPAPQPVQPAPQPEQPAAVHYANCDAVRAAGKAPLHAGQPGYRSGLDRDGDGTACDK
ncbi:thermonuclease family protein [Saccharothrix isguenensis]